LETAFCFEITAGIKKRYEKGDLLLLGLIDSCPYEL